MDKRQAMLAACDTIAERNAVCNGCTHVFVLRDDDAPRWDNPYKWRIFIATDSNFPGGFPHGGCHTRKEALGLVESRYPNFSASYQHGRSLVWLKDESNALHAAKRGLEYA